jgi:hypothetical protein
MKNAIIILLLAFSMQLQTQSYFKVDSLKKESGKAKDDTERVWLMHQISSYNAHEEKHGWDTLVPLN